ncbi:MAG: transferrin receptor-like dimerization domain-containing protein, partial [Flavihumibacter sp.]
LLFAQTGKTDKYEAQFDGYLSAQSIGNTIKELSAKPHELGSAGSKEVAEKVLQKFKSYGWNAELKVYQVLFPTPKERLLEMTSPAKYKAGLKEPALKEDPSTGQPGELPTYNAWSADGDVNGPLVFVNYGLPADYEWLEKLGVDVKGKIVIAKYGRSWRGIKPKLAQEHGAVGCIIYSDPEDDGYAAGDVYPKGPFKNEYGVQRGSVMDMPVYPGDPLTPGVGATENAPRIQRSEAENLLKIPVLPIGYKDARPLLESLDGPVAPPGWQGALPFTYHVGGGKTNVHLKLAFNWKTVPCYDVIATLPGSEFPDEWVIRGNHHDAWVYGADDPISGLAAVLEEAKAIGEMVKAGWKPKRTLVYCAWDGEEPALLGSTEYVEDNMKELQEKAVIYINSDGNGRGFLGIGGSHALHKAVNEVAAAVIDPQTNVSVAKRLLAKSVIDANSTNAKKQLIAKKEIELSALGSGSDYSPFFQHAGIPSLNIGFGGESSGGEYHSIYDSYENYRRFKDPSFEYGVALAKTAGHFALKIADADILPFEFTDLYKTISGYADELQKFTDDLRESYAVDNEIRNAGLPALAKDTARHWGDLPAKPAVPFLNFSPLQNALAKLKTTTAAIKPILSKTTDPAKTKAINKILYTAEQQLLLEQGLPRRKWYKHSIYAPGFYTGYGVKTLPSIREAIEQNDWAEAQQGIEDVSKAIVRLSDYLSGIAK